MEARYAHTFHKSYNYTFEKVHWKYQSRFVMNPQACKPLKNVFSYEMYNFRWILVELWREMQEREQSIPNHPRGNKTSSKSPGFTLKRGSTTGISSLSLLLHYWTRKQQNLGYVEQSGFHACGFVFLFFGSFNWRYLNAWNVDLWNVWADVDHQRYLPYASCPNENTYHCSFRTACG